MRFILHKFCRVFFGAPAHNENIDKDTAHIADCDQAAEQHPHCGRSDADKYTHEVEHQNFYRYKKQKENRKTKDESLFLHEVHKEREHEAYRTPGT